MTADYKAFGAAATLFRCNDPEILIQGPAGTGKTRACLERIHLLAETNAGARFLLMRKTRARMAQSVLVTFEDHVLPPGHELLKGTVSRP